MHGMVVSLTVKHWSTWVLMMARVSDNLLHAEPQRGRLRMHSALVSQLVWYMVQEPRGERCRMEEEPFAAATEERHWECFLG